MAADLAWFIVTFEQISRRRYDRSWSTVSRRSSQASLATPRSNKPLQFPLRTVYRLIDLGPRSIGQKTAVHLYY